PTSAVPKERDGPISVSGIRYSSTSDSTTIAIDLEHEVKYKGERLNSPERVYFDLQGTRLLPNLLGKSLTLNELAVSKIRVAQPQFDVTRVSLETKGFCDYSTKVVSNPTRLLIEVRPHPQSKRAQPKTVYNFIPNERMGK